MEANFFGGKPGRSLFAVFDGHGTNGMHVAKACKTYSPNAIAQSLAAAENVGVFLLRALPLNLCCKSPQLMRLCKPR